jgi:environmental stress-induced protein Ves
MKIILIKSENFQIKNWSGGTTTELYIYPSNSIFKERLFDFRLSKATIETEHSEFTALPDINRTLMVLEGETSLIHKNHHSKTLKKFDTDNFKGEWETKSIGACTDFNLMTNYKINGQVNGQSYLENQKVELSFNENDKWFFIYVNEGRIISLLNDTEFEISTGDLLVIEEFSNETIHFDCLAKSDLVFVTLSE